MRRILSGAEILEISERSRLIKNIEEILNDIQPASIDLRIVEIRKGDHLMTRMNLEDFYRLPKISLPCILEKGKIYYALTNVEIDPEVLKKEDILVVVSGKSSLGRIFVKVLGVFPDGLNKTRESERIIVAIIPEVFNIYVDEGYRIGQVRFEKKETIKYFDFLLNNKKVFENICHLRVYTGEAFESVENDNPIDIEKKRFYDSKKYFVRIENENGIILEPGKGYLLRTKDFVSLGFSPAFLSFELSVNEYAPLEFFSHQCAGFGDPGFGCGGEYGRKKEKEAKGIIERKIEEFERKGSNLTVEMLKKWLKMVGFPKENGACWVLELVPRHRVLIEEAYVKMIVYQAVKIPAPLYGPGIGSSYFEQKGIRLGKFFY